ncbi:MAG: DNA repair protein RecN [Gammaproteobacteria bacterium]|nr:DNA repair protein RecN [Gammaproteobacteria bacterium]MYF02476.1 DNA repair protein RecN [Gammaproteobacteria bacterium]MYI77425.1 DNA repair protein RecN [Gammaproteobacteria bacterium]
MLATLTVRNFTLVRSLDIDFSPGLTVITGESGAGKSILLDALALVLGARVRQDQIAAGSNDCEVIAEFDLSQSPATRKKLEQQGLADSLDPSLCVVRRTATPGGRSRAWLNSTPTNLDSVRDLCASLIGVHGQFEQHELLNREAQLEWFDDFAIKQKQLSEVERLYQAWQDSKTALRTSSEELGLDLSQKELLEYQYAELESLELEENEFPTLMREFKRHSQARQILAVLAEAEQTLNDSVQPLVTRISREIQGVDDQEKSLNEARELISSTEIQLEEIRNSLVRYRDSVDIDESQMEALDQRINLIHDVARKHKVSPSALFEHVTTVKARLERLKQSESELTRLQQELEEREKKFFKYSEELSQSRQKQAEAFCAEVLKTLGAIALPEVSFDVSFARAQNSRGVDALEYLVSTNKGYDVMPLSRVASGGELSRIALAILLVVARKSKLPTLILDEADIGVGGTTADVIGRMLRSLAQNNQVICVTHAPQVAALGDAHLFVTKCNTQGINVESLTGEQRVAEIARMVGGRTVDDRSRTYARALLQDALS